MLRRVLIGLAAVAAFALPAAAQDHYVIGLTGAMTGPAAGSLAPAVEGIRLYVERLNAAGGINGKKVELILQDDAAEPSKAAANVKKLLTQDNVILLINASLSSTYAPMLAEVKRAKVPVLYMGAVCPKEVLPPAADALQFCSTGFAQGYDSRAILGFVKETASEPVRIGFASMAIPISRGETEYAMDFAKGLGMTPVDHEVIPPPTPDYTPFATKLKELNPNWVFSWAPWVTEVRTVEALRKLGWDGSYIATAHLEAEGELPRVKDPKFYVMGANALFAEDSPTHREITAAAKAANAKYPPSLMTEGWLGGMVVEAALKKAGWPADAAKVADALSSLKVDTKGLRGGVLEWTKDNHYRTHQYYRVYRWDTDKSAIVRVKDWIAYEVK
jgi:branched-chain amino acid transport system substrate-binding protein